MIWAPQVSYNLTSKDDGTGSKSQGATGNDSKESLMRIPTKEGDEKNFPLFAAATSLRAQPLIMESTLTKINEK